MFDMIEFRQLGIDVTLAKEIDDSLQLSSEVSDRRGLAIVCDVIWCRAEYIGDG